MDSDGSITATGDKFVNNSNVNAKGNITITANEFRNEVEGGDTRVWSYAGTSFDGLQTPGDQDNRSGAHGPDPAGNGEAHHGVLNRAEERRVGKGCDSQSRTRVAPVH